MDFQSILTDVGEFVSNTSAKGITYLTYATPVKIITIIILLSIGYLALKIAKPIVKWTIIILVVFLVASTGYTLFN